ncbi:hypothetical protein BABINDRAFT_31339 [Babjeviella inositovora NRRL Y-12698]|uniref:Eukaryotic translation initiation factor 3 subunit E n=1 Tax=Babjeviella inositovora NRRL Y-12698 TaxID=984486 RepID=A0A1E3QZT2_9ASCO|nr:uncharacterized protein BABINDRAFT_31339 [Babjeviella inositovora NRRL Y-12698]ODQ83054.1 hypothetical protein BABINDRAFT_31339 [Babjeviella inositovora NRRL Y-12698]
MPLTAEELTLARQYDLTQKFVPFLDRHLDYPLIEFLGNEAVYDDQVINQLIYDLLKDTNMFKFVKDTYKKLNPTSAFPQELLDKEETFTAEATRLGGETQEILDVIGRDDVKAHFSEDKSQNCEYLAKNFGIDASKINKLYQYGLLKYNKGDYETASDLLYTFRLLSTDSESLIAATWGYLSCQIILLQWEKALQELQKLRDIIDSRSYADPATQLHHRTWIIHHFLFPFTNTETGLELMCDLFFQSSYVSTIQAACPWILRYLVVAVISTKNHKRMRDLVRIIAQESYEYNDPLTLLVKSMYIDFDIQKVEQYLVECQIIIKTDFFLSNCTSSSSSFLDNARAFVLEVYLKIYSVADVAKVARLLNLDSTAEAVALLKTFSAASNHVSIEVVGETATITKTAASVHQQVVEKTKHLSYKSTQLLNAQKEKSS